MALLILRALRRFKRFKKQKKSPFKNKFKKLLNGITGHQYTRHFRIRRKY